MAASLPIGEADSMLIKAADDPRPTLDALEGLLARPGLSSTTRLDIERQVTTTRSGVKGEQDAAYEIDFQFGAKPNYMIVHDLRLEVGERVAQIDHLIINRLLDIWVCETKHFAQGVAISEFGEWTAFYGTHPRGIASPIEQNSRHMTVLADALDRGLVELPVRLGMTIRPRISGLVLISNEARITRPPIEAAARVAGLESVIKVERLKATIITAVDERNPAAYAKLVSLRTLEAFARQLATLHVPIQFDWARKFGIPAQTQTPASSRERPSGRTACLDCGRHVSEAVIAFCQSRPVQFGGGTYCVDCQVPFVTARP